MQIPNKWAIHLLLVCAPAVLVSCQMSPSDPNSSGPESANSNSPGLVGPVADIGEHQITAEEFRIAYELASPSKFPVTDDPLERKRYFLDRMVEQKVLALAGISEGLDTAGAAVSVINWERRQSLIRALYRTNIEAYIEVTEDDLREAFIQSNEVVALRQILVPNRGEAVDIYRRILTGESFESIVVEMAPPDMPPARVLAPHEFDWGDLDARLEAAASGLNHMEVSAPIETQSGFHILQLVDRRQQVILTEAAFDARRSYLDQMIRRRRGDAASEDYLRTLAAGRPMSVRSKTVMEMAEAARAILRERVSDVPVPQAFQALEVEGEFGELGSEIIADVGADDSAADRAAGWTVDGLVLRIAAMPPDDRPDLTVPASIAKTIAILVRADLLVGEALHQGLLEDATVVDDVQRLREELASRQKRAELFSKIEITDAGVQAFYADSAARYLVPERVRVKEVMVRSKSLADSVLVQAQTGADLADLARQYSVRTWAAERGGDLGLFTAAAFGSVGAAAFAAPIGELVGPIPVLVDSIPVGYSVLRVTERVPAELPELESIEKRVARDARLDAQEHAITNFMTATSDRWPVAKDYDALASIRTTDEMTDGRPMDMVVVKRAN